MGTKRDDINDPKLAYLMHDTGVALDQMAQSLTTLAKWFTDNAIGFDDAGVNTSAPSALIDQLTAQTAQLGEVIDTFYGQISQEDLPDHNDNPIQS